MKLRAGARGAHAAALFGLVLLATAGVTGCNQNRGSKSRTRSVEQVAIPGRSPERAPAATAGGACQLLDFYAVEELIGVHFEVAASSSRDTTASCVVQPAGAAFPDLTLAITPTAATDAAFRSTGFPTGATPVDGIGLAAYQVLRPAAPGADPAGPGVGVELGWLAKNGRLMVIRYRFAAQAQQAEADGMAVHLVELAKFLDS